MQSKKGEGTAYLLIATVIVMIIFVVGFYPAMQDSMTNITTSTDPNRTLDTFSTMMMYITPAGIFIAILVGILFIIFGNKRDVPQ